MNSYQAAPSRDDSMQAARAATDRGNVCERPHSRRRVGGAAIDPAVGGGLVRMPHAVEIVAIIAVGGGLVRHSKPPSETHRQSGGNAASADRPVCSRLGTTRGEPTRAACRCGKSPAESPSLAGTRESTGDVRITTPTARSPDMPYTPASTERTGDRPWRRAVGQLAPPAKTSDSHNRSKCNS